MKIRFAYNHDYEKIVEINETSNFHFSDKELLLMLKDKFTVGIVAVNEADTPTGFCVYQMKNPESFDMVDLVVLPEFQRQKIGSELMCKMKSKLNKKRHTITIRVFESNMQGQLFLKNMGFKSKLIRSEPEDIIEFIYKKEQSCF
jgi:ribosomal protein S18 acetylase RimI-like enzyme